jgi:hypothetical protein
MGEHMGSGNDHMGSGDDHMGSGTTWAAEMTTVKQVCPRTVPLTFSDGCARWSVTLQ